MDVTNGGLISKKNKTCICHLVSYATNYLMSNALIWFTEIIHP